MSKPHPPLQDRGTKPVQRVEALVVIHSDSLTSYAFEGGDANALAERIIKALSEHKHGPTVVVHQDWGTEITERFLRTKPTAFMVFDEAESELTHFGWDEFIYELAEALRSLKVTDVVLAGAWCTRSNKWGCVNETQQRLTALGFTVRVDPALVAYADETPLGDEEQSNVSGASTPFTVVQHEEYVAVMVTRDTYAVGYLPAFSKQRLLALQIGNLKRFIETHNNLSHISWVGVEEARRHQGIGRQLLTGLEHELAMRGVEWVVLEASASQPKFQAPLEAWYRSQGYNEIPEAVEMHTLKSQMMCKRLIPVTHSGPEGEVGGVAGVPVLSVLERAHEILVSAPEYEGHALAVARYDQGRALYKWMQTEMDLKDASQYLWPHPRISAYVTSVEVPADVQRQGLGSRLLGRMEQELRGKKAQRILLHALSFGGRPQVDLVRWYQERGYQAADKREATKPYCEFCLMLKDLGTNGFDETKHRLKHAGFCWEDWIGQAFTRDEVMSFLDATSATDCEGELDYNGLKEATIVSENWTLALIKFADVLGWNWTANESPVNRTPIVTWGAKHGWAVTDGMHRVGAARARGEAGILAFIPAE